MDIYYRSVKKIYLQMGYIIINTPVVVLLKRDIIFDILMKPDLARGS